MVAKLLWVLSVLVVIWLLDRLLLRLERRGWINYRRRGLSRSGAAFHALTLQSIFSPGAEQLQEVRYQQVEEEDDSGDPPPPPDQREPEAEIPSVSPEDPA
jgi:hypothetical protein